MKNDTEKLYQLNKKTYLTDFKPYYEKHMNPQHLLQFPILLPFGMPVKDGTCVTLLSDDGEACTYHFMSIQTSESINPGILNTKIEKVPVLISRVEMIYVSEKEFKHEDINGLSDRFDELLRGLNDILVSYMIIKKDINIHRVTRNMLQFSSMYRYLTIQNWNNQKVGLFLLL